MWFQASLGVTCYAAINNEDTHASVIIWQRWPYLHAWWVGGWLADGRGFFTWVQSQASQSSKRGQVPMCKCFFKPLLASHLLTAFGQSKSQSQLMFRGRGNKLHLLKAEEEFVATFCNYSTWGSCTKHPFLLHFLTLEQPPFCATLSQNQHLTEHP